MDSVASPFSIFLVFVLGACLGSFATALIYRLPLKKPWFLNGRDEQGGVSRSICPSCGHALSIPDLVPILSWISSLGKCRYCGAKIPGVYPVTELIVAFVAVILFLLMGPVWTFVPVLLGLPFLTTLIVVNVRSGENFLSASIAVFLLGLLSCLLGFKGQGDILAAILLPMVMGVSGLIAFGWNAIKGRYKMESLFLAGAGLFVGLQGLPLFLLVTAPLIATSVIYCVITKRKSIDFFPAIYSIALIFHFFLTGIGFDGRAVY